MPRRTTISDLSVSILIILMLNVFVQFSLPAAFAQTDGSANTLQATTQSTGVAAPIGQVDVGNLPSAPSVEQPTKQVPLLHANLTGTRQTTPELALSPTIITTPPPHSTLDQSQASAGPQTVVGVSA